LAGLPGEDPVGGTLSLSLLVVDRVDDPALFKHEISAASSVLDHEAPGGAVQHEELAQIEEADEPQLSPDGRLGRGAHAASRRSAGPGAASAPSNSSRLLMWGSASSGSTIPSRTRPATASSMVRMLSRLPVWMTEASWKVLRSRMSEETAPFPSST